MRVAEGTALPGSEAPLAGRSVVVTRAREQAASLVGALSALGAEVVAFPAIAIVEPPDAELEALHDAIRRLPEYDWVVFSSANGVRRFFAHLVNVDRTSEALSHVKIAVVGSATAEKMRALGVEPDLVPADFRAEGLVDAFRAQGAGPGWRVLAVRALEGREVLERELRELGVRVDAAVAYRTVPAEPDPAVVERLREGVDAVTFTSPSTVTYFLAFLAAAGIDPDAFMRGTLAASIGPVTTDALRARGYEAGAEARPSTAHALAAAIAEALGPR